MRQSGNRSFAKSSGLVVARAFPLPLAVRRPVVVTTEHGTQTAKQSIGSGLFRQAQRIGPHGAVDGVQLVRQIQPRAYFWLLPTSIVSCPLPRQTSHSCQGQPQPLGVSLQQFEQDNFASKHGAMLLSPPLHCHQKCKPICFNRKFGMVRMTA